MIQGAKLTPPPVYKHYVKRSRLEKILEDVLVRPLAIISAPPGSGKTSLLSYWINQLSSEGNQSRYSTSWVTLDSQHNDLFHFWSRILSAFTCSSEDLNLNQVLNTTKSINAVIDLWVNSFVEQHSEYILVLDDYQQIQDPIIHNSVLYLLEHLPNNLHIIFSTRIDPPFPLSRWRIQNKLVEIRSIDLLFNEPEIVDFFELQSGSLLQPGQIKEITKRTEGWAAGLQVIALSIKGLNTELIDQRIFGFSGRHRYFADFVTDEVISHLPQDILGFLTLTSLLNKLSASLCESLLEDSEIAGLDAQKTLLYLLQNNLFISSLDDENEWFRLHPLFQELLLSRLKAQKSVDFINDLYRKAACWFYSHGDINQAITLSITAHDSMMTADILSSILEKADIWSSGEIHTILQWINSLPESIIYKRPWLRLYQSRALFVAGKISESESILDQLESAANGEDKQLLAQINCSRARIAAINGHVNLTIEYAQKAIDSLSPDYSMAHSSALSSIGYALLLAGRLEESLHWLNSAMDEAKTNGFILLQVNLLVNMGWIYYQLGQNDKLELTLEQGFELCQFGKQYIPIAGLLFILMAEYQYAQGNITSALEALNRGLALLEQGGIEDSSQKSSILMSKIFYAQNNHTIAWQYIEKASFRVKKTVNERTYQYVESAKADFYLKTGQLNKAIKWALDYYSMDEVDYIHYEEDLILARIFLADGDVKKCLAICNKVEQQAAEISLKRTIIEANLILSMAYYELKQHDSSQAAFLKSLLLAESSNTPQMILDEYVLLHPIILEAQKRGVKLNLLSDLINTSNPNDPSHSTLIQPLSDREIEVIQLIAEGLTNQEIAARLVVAETTVKKHISHIFYKLNVTNRTQVMITAHKLKIV